MIVLFDGVCNLCNASVNFIIDRDAKAVFKFASLQSDFGQKILNENQLKQADFDSILLLKEDKILKKSDAALEIARNLEGWWKFFYVLKVIPKFIRDFGYDLIAKNRYRIFGKSETCRIPTAELKARFL